jgi:hypothetical protein
MPEKFPHEFSAMEMPNIIHWRGNHFQDFRFIRIPWMIRAIKSSV